MARKNLSETNRKAFMAAGSAADRAHAAEMAAAGYVPPTEIERLEAEISLLNASGFTLVADASQRRLDALRAAQTEA